MNHLAATPNAAAATPVPHSSTARRIDASARPGNPGTARARAGASSTTPGQLVGRPDLSAEAVLAAIVERMAFEGRDVKKAQAVLDAALAGRPVACTYMRRLVLPPPQSALQMPIQSILREPKPDAAAKAADGRGS